MGIIDVIANNLFFSSIVILSMAAVLFSLLRAANRAWEDAWWLSERFNAIVYAPLLTVAFELGWSFLYVGFTGSGSNPLPAQTWMMILAQPLLISLFLSAIDPIFPEIVRDLISWVPTVALSLVFRYSFSSGAAIGQIMTSSAVVLGSAALLLSTVRWKVARMDR